MKILQIITQPVLGGAQSVVIELSNALAENNHDIIVMSKKSGAMWESLNADIKRVYCNHFRRNISPINDIKSYFAIRKCIKKEKPDIIHLHTSKVGLLGRLAAWPKHTKKTFYTMHGFDQVRLAHKEFLFLEKIFKNLCFKIIAISKYDLKNLHACGIKNTELIYNAVRDKKNIKLDNKILQQIKDFSREKKILLSVSRDAKPKRFDLFLEVAKNCPHLSFIWIGNKEPKENIPNNMMCLGEVINGGAYISLADAFILLSDHEGLPISLIESLSCGVPIIASNVGGIPEVVKDSCGITTENTAEKIIASIDHLFSNPTIYDSMRNLSRKEFEKYYSIKKMKDSYLKVYLNNNL